MFGIINSANNKIIFGAVLSVDLCEGSILCDSPLYSLRLNAIDLVTV